MPLLFSLRRNKMSQIYFQGRVALYLCYTSTAALFFLDTLGSCSVEM